MTPSGQREQSRFPRGNGPRSSLIRTLPGVVFARELLPPLYSVPDHKHDWLTVLIPVAGQFVTRTDSGAQHVAATNVVAHPGGGSHSASIGALGLDAVNVMIEPAYLHRRVGRRDRHVHCAGPVVFRAGRELIATLRDPCAPDDLVSAALDRLLAAAFLLEKSCVPAWLERAERALDAWPPPSIASVARNLDLNPEWMAQAYKMATGEGLRDRAIRRRVERAVMLLRNGTEPLSSIAVEAGFCDQSHLNRCVKRHFGLTPRQIRMERDDGSSIPAMSIDDHVKSLS